MSVAVRGDEQDHLVASNEPTGSAPTWLRRSAMVVFTTDQFGTVFYKRHHGFFHGFVRCVLRFKLGSYFHFMATVFNHVYDLLVGSFTSLRFRDWRSLYGAVGHFAKGLPRYGNMFYAVGNLHLSGAGLKFSWGLTKGQRQH